MGLNKRDVLRRLKGRKIELVSEWKGPVETEHTFRCTADPAHGEWKDPAKRVLVDGAGCRLCPTASNALSTKRVQDRLAKKGLRLEGDWVNSYQDYTVHCTAELGHTPQTLTGFAVLRFETACPPCAALKKAAYDLRHPKRPPRHANVRQRRRQPSALV